MARFLPLLTLVAALLVAGCLGATDTPLDAAAPMDAAVQPPPPTPVDLSGRAWLPSSQSEERERTEIPFMLDAPGAAGTVTLRLGASYGVEVPPLISSVEVQVLAPDGSVLAEAMLDMGTPEARMELADLLEGSHLLVLESYGGSGGGYGDFVDYSVSLA